MHDPSAVYEDVEVAELGQACFERGVPGLLLRDIACDGGMWAVWQGLGGFGQVVAVDIDEDQGAAFGGEFDGDAPAEANGGACHDSGFVAEAVEARHDVFGLGGIGDGEQTDSNVNKENGWFVKTLILIRDNDGLVEEIRGTRSSC